MIDVQSISQETFESFTVEELEKKYTWMSNSENLKLLFPESTPEEAKKNSIIFKEDNRKEPRWIPYSVLLRMLNGFQNVSDFCNKTLLFTGYAIRPRDDGSTSEKKCSISVRSNLFILGVQNEKDLKHQMIVCPDDVKMVIPTVDGTKPVELKAKQIQDYQTATYRTLYSVPLKPAVLMDKQQCEVLEYWKKNGIPEKSDENSLMIKIGVSMNVANENDKGFHLRE